MLRVLPVLKPGLADLASKLLSRSYSYVHQSAYWVPILQPAFKGKSLYGEFSELFQMNKKASLFVSLATATTSFSFEGLFGCLFGLSVLFPLFTHLNLQCNLLIVEHKTALTLSTALKSLEIFSACSPSCSLANTYNFHSACWNPLFWSTCEKGCVMNPFPFLFFNDQERNEVIGERSNSQVLAFQMIYNVWSMC